MEKKASDTLAEIQGDIKSLKKTVELLNFQYSMVLERLNSINSKIDTGNFGGKGGEPFSLQSNFGGGTVTSPESPPMATAPVINSSNINNGEPLSIPTASIIPARKTVANSQFDFEETVMGGDEVIEDKTSLPEKVNNVPITQILYSPLGKAMTLATVEVIDPKGKIVAKTRTNSSGRWQALVAPGTYQTHVVRRYDNNLVDFTQDIKIGPSANQLEIVAPEEYQKTVKEK